MVARIRTLHEMDVARSEFRELRSLQKSELLERAGNFVSVLQDLSVPRRVRRRLYIFLIQALVIALGVKSDPAPSFH